QASAVFPLVLHAFFRGVSTGGSMCGVSGEFGFGIEEEDFLADLDTLEVRPEVPEALFKDIAAATGGRTGHESLQPQLEVRTEPQFSGAAVRDRLISLRRRSVQTAKDHGFAILAAGTHPTANWPHVAPTSSERYSKVMDSLQMIGRRNMLCGLHVHVE